MPNLKMSHEFASTTLSNNRFFFNLSEFIHLFRRDQDKNLRVPAIKSGASMNADPFSTLRCVIL